MIKNEKEYLKQWLFRANEDIAVMQTLAEQSIDSYTSTICFHCQQAVEKFLKALLVFHKIDFPKTHDVDFLLKKCSQVENLNFNNIDLKDLSDFGVDIRYPDDFYIPDISETKEYIEIALKIKKVAEEEIEFT